MAEGERARPAAYAVISKPFGVVEQQIHVIGATQEEALCLMDALLSCREVMWEWVAVRRCYPSASLLLQEPTRPTDQQ